MICITNFSSMMTVIWFDGLALVAKNGRAGAIAGRVNDNGYLVVGVYGKSYRAHRIIYHMFHGHCPEFVDHNDRNPAEQSN